MGKSPGSNYDTPESWKPPEHMINQPGQSAPVRKDTVPRFLPNDPKAMANGLTPEMVALILGIPPEQLASAQAQSATADPAAGRADLAALLTPKTSEVLP